ncbi:unnamed protein product [Heterosigma akashiwo]
MTQLQVGDDGRVVPVMKVKLSVAGDANDRGVREVCWAGPAAVQRDAGEAFVLFWDLANDENYVLTVTGGQVEKDDRATTVAFNPLQRYLAVGERGGQVVMWKFEGTLGGLAAAAATALDGPVGRGGGCRGSRGALGAGGWGGVYRAEPCSLLLLPAPLPGERNDEASPGGRAGGGRRRGGGRQVVRLAWGPGRGLLGVGAPRGAALLAETVLHRALRDGVAVLQTGTKSLQARAGRAFFPRRTTCPVCFFLQLTTASFPTGQVETTDGVAFPVTTRVPVKGVAVDATSLVVWSGKEAVVYQLATAGGRRRRPRGLGAATEKGAFRAATRRWRSSPPGGAHTIFQAVGSKLEQVNFGGVVLNDITFSEAEGRPVLLDTNGHFLAVATDRGVIKLYNTRRERKAPAQMGSAGRFVDAATRRPLGAMRSIAVNADGTRLSILSDHVHGGSLSIREPDTRLHVYDADKDTAGGGGSGAAGAGRWPAAHFWDPVEPKLLACETRRLKGGGADATNKKMTQQPTAKASEAKTKEAGEGKDAPRVSPGRRAARYAARRRGHDAFATADYGILMQDAFLSDISAGLWHAAFSPYFVGPGRAGGEVRGAGRRAARPRRSARW